MTGSHDVVVLGGGIAGLTVAIECAELGLDCSIIAAQTPGSATAASAGLLAPSLGGFSEATQPYAFEARDLYPHFVRRIESATGSAVPLLRDGIVELLPGPGTSPRDLRLLSSAELHELEPALSSDALAVLHPYDGAVDVPRLLAALERWVSSHGNIHVVRAIATSIDQTGTGFRVHCDGSAGVTGEQVVIAAGAWSPDIESPFSRLPITPVSGQTLAISPNPLRRPLYSGGRYLVPRGDELIAGASSVNSGLDAHVDSTETEALLAFARRVLPVVPLLPLRGLAGIRPMSPDGLPILGPDPANSRVHYACGYSRNGILFAPWAALRIARAIAGGHLGALKGFSLGRFDQISNR